MTMSSCNEVIDPWRLIRSLSNGECQRAPSVTFALQAALPVGLALGLAAALQALVLQKGLLSLQLPQRRLQFLPAAHLKSIVETLWSTCLTGFIGGGSTGSDGPF